MSPGHQISQTDVAPCPVPWTLRTSSASMASATGTCSSDTVYPRDRAIWMIESRVTPGRMVPCAARWHLGDPVQLCSLAWTAVCKLDQCKHHPTAHWRRKNSATHV